MICSKCGTQLPDTARFCGNCGAFISSATVPPIQEGSHPPPAWTFPGGTVTVRFNRKFIR
ncbi:MAG: zinc ribbon domain-containing protein [Clostridiales bacterium]|jgi:predicted amidophosphoribosyltransferase|nr:zinc ribbon domain-containing protein [Clostridiales bacterium]